MIHTLFVRYYPVEESPVSLMFSEFDRYFHQHYFPHYYLGYQKKKRGQIFIDTEEYGLHRNIFLKGADFFTQECLNEMYEPVFVKDVKGINTYQLEKVSIEVTRQHEQVLNEMKPLIVDTVRYILETEDSTNDEKAHSICTIIMYWLDHNDPVFTRVAKDSNNDVEYWRNSFLIRCFIIVSLLSKRIFEMYRPEIEKRIMKGFNYGYCKA